MKRLALLFSLAAGAWMFAIVAAQSQDPIDPSPQVDPVLIDDLSPEAKAQAEEAAREREAERAALALPESPEAALAAALRNNPDILLADAKVRQAEAELNQVRLKTVQDVLVAYKQYETDKQMVARAEALTRSATIGVEEVLQAQQALVESEAALRYLLGVPARGAEALPEVAMERSVVPQPTPSALESTARPALPEDLQHALSAEVEVDFVELPLADVLTFLTEQTGVAVVLEPGLAEGINIQLRLGTTSWRNVLVAVSDLYGYCFVVRDYGLLATGREQGKGLAGAAIPADLPYDASVVREGGGGGFF